MLKISCIITSRSKYHINAAGVDVVHDLLQHIAVITVVHDIIAAEGFRTAAPAERPGDERIGGTGWHSQVILQDIPGLILAQYKVYT